MKLLLSVIYSISLILIIPDSVSAQENQASGYDTIEYVIEYDTIDLPPDTVYFESEKFEENSSRIQKSINITLGGSIAIGNIFKLQGENQLIEKYLKNNTPILNKWSISSSYQLSHKRITYSYGINFTNFQTHTFHTESSGCSCDSKRYINNSNYLGMHLGGTFYIHKELFGIGMHVSSALLINKEANFIFVDENAKVGYLRNNDKALFNFAILPFIFGQIELNRSWNFHANLGYNMLLTSLLDDSLLYDYKPNLVSIKLGVNYKI